ncbi:pilus assembly protein PilP [Methylosoma difficile]
MKAKNNACLVGSLRACCTFLVVILAGCADHELTDLNQYVREVKARPKGQIVPLPDINVIEPFVFKSDDLRDPFKPMTHPEEVLDANVSVTGGGLRPDLTRRKEELEAFPLDGLKMVGTVAKKSVLWGLIKASDNTVHRVQSGNYMGKNFGKIIRISPDKIELLEMVPDRPGTWREQQTTLALVE